MSQSPAITIQPLDRFQAQLRLPGSKSLTNRALLLAALAKGSSTLGHPLLDADDAQRMIAGLTQLGLSLKQQTDCIQITGMDGHWPDGKNAALNLGNAGTAYRFLTAACCLAPEGSAVILDGIARMRERPIAQLVDALRQLGARIDYLGRDGYPPLRVHGGGLHGGRIVMPSTLSSQYLSALLQVGPYCREGLTLVFEGPVTSRPYVEMTLGLMARFGLTAQVDDAFTQVMVPPGSYRGTEYEIEPDASNASYFLAAAALLAGSRCTVQGLGFRSLQGDVWFAQQVLEPMGASVLYEPNALTVIAPPAGCSLRGIDVDLNAMPDMAQTLAVLALFARGPTAIRNVGNLRVKETDRLTALSNELSKLGAKVQIEDDDLLIDPPRQVQPASIQTYDDHRMAMSFSLAGLRVAGVTIQDPACVGKTFPRFFEYLALLGSDSTSPKATDFPNPTEQPKTSDQ